jgi:hypothetical protein
MAAFGLTLLLASAAAAEPSKEDMARAEALFRAAQALLQAGDVAEACAKFAQSYGLDPAPGALLNLGVCHDKEGKTATAYRELQQLVQAIGASKNRDDRERVRFATDALAKLDARLTRAAFNVSALPAGSTLKLDGTPVADVTLVLPIDPGDHQIEITAPGRPPKSVPWTVLPQPGTQTFKADPPDAATAVPAAAPAGAKAPAPSPAKHATRSDEWRRPAAYAWGAVGLVAIGIGSYFGIDTLNKRDARDPHCVGTVCDAAGMSLDDKAHTSATISTIAFVGGFAALGAGAYFLFTAPSGKKAAAVRAAPTLGGLAVEGGF